MTQCLAQPSEAAETDWRPGDPLYPAEHYAVSYSVALSDCCPPECWCHFIPRGGQAMRWTPEYPVLRFGSAWPHGVAS